jgi:hypothetical protein
VDRPEHRALTADHADCENRRCTVGWNSALSRSRWGMPANGRPWRGTSSLLRLQQALPWATAGLRLMPE